MLELLHERDFDAFFSYLDAHLKENGVGSTPLFQPQSRSQNGLPHEKRAVIADGLRVAVGRPGWRRMWVWRDAGGHVAGHIDLRARPEAFTSHRALLGMGLAPALRGQGIGLLMLDAVQQWGRESGVIEVIDLDVLAGNAPAVQLYRKAGFEVVGRIEDLFRIDGKSEAQILMWKKL